MDNLDFRKWLTQYGYTYEDYEKMQDNEKKEIHKRFKSENTGENLKKAGDGIKGCGCIIILLPLLAFLLYFIFTILFG